MLQKLLGRILKPRFKGWTLGVNGEEVHVLPVRDWTDHDVEDCVCGVLTEPCLREDGSIGWLITHYSLDGRERFE